MEFELNVVFSYYEAIHKRIMPDGKQYSFTMTDLWELTKKAKAGDIEAQLAVAHAFETGEGIEQNIQEAFNWYKLASENGDAEGYYRAGCCVRKLAPNKIETIAKWFYEAARIGHLKAQIELGLYGYYESLPVEDKEKAEIYWLRKAAEQGDEKSQTALGIKLSDLCYFEEAVSWFTKASEQGSAEAKYHLGELYRKGLGIESSPEKAFHLYKESAEGFCPEGMRELGKCYLEGIGTDEDENEAFYWFKEGAGFDDAESYYHLGRCYHSGWGTVYDDEEEFSAFQEAVEWASLNETPMPKAKLMLGICYYDGTGVDVDYEEAIRLFEQAAEEGVASALYMLGECYYHGHGVRKNRKKAFSYYLQTAEKEEHDDAEYSLGFCYENGEGTKEDILKAIYWYTKAEIDGSYDAKERLDILLQRK